jgi:hypothetical protein
MLHSVVAVETGAEVVTAAAAAVAAVAASPVW